MKFKSEQDIMEELVESIYSGNVEEEDSKDKDESKEEVEEKDTETTEETEDSKEEVDNDSKDEGKDSEEEDEDETDEDSEEPESSDGDDELSPKAGGAFKSQVKSLKKQYNDLLVDSFEKYSTECIEDALDEVDSAFGENIEDILNLAMDKLKAKIMGDLGVESSGDDEGIPPAAMGSFDPIAGAGNPMEISIEKGA